MTIPEQLPQAPPPTKSEAAAMRLARPCHICGERPIPTPGGRLEIVHNFRLHYPEKCRPVGEVHSTKDRHDPESREEARYA